MLPINEQQGGGRRYAAGGFYTGFYETGFIQI